jgi:hypothetical protein
MSRLSAALIVRNESRFIEDCLRSLAGVVDEIVIVDTGSTDDTIEKALRFPIKLHQFAWCDDFSAARNFALEHASGEWILYIDADERLVVPDRGTLDMVVGDKGKVAWKLRFCPRIDWTPYAELRLFRNDPRIRFQGVIHERMHEGVEHVAISDRLEIGQCNLMLQHVGYEDDQAHKNPRNIPLLRANLTHDPDHVYSWWHLGESLRLAGDVHGAIAAWTQGVAVARAVPATVRRSSHALSAASLIRLQVERGVSVDDLLREARELYPEHLTIRWIDATIALERGDNDTSRPILEMLASIDPESFFDHDVSYEKALFRHLAQDALALCYFRMGRFLDAARCYRLAAQNSPDPGACEIKARLAERRATSA